MRPGEKTGLPAGGHRRGERRLTAAPHKGRANPGLTRAALGRLTSAPHTKLAECDHDHT